MPIFHLQLSNGHIEQQDKRGEYMKLFRKEPFQIDQ